MSSLKLRKEKDCLNCGHQVEENYCPHCGQENVELKENAWHMIVHAIADYFHFEHKFFATFKPLILTPGKLTVDYVAGKRASFLHPIKLYIFISILFFIVAFSSTQVKNADDNKSSNKYNAGQELKDSTDLEQLTTVLKHVPIAQSLKDSIISDEIKQLKIKETDTATNKGNKKSRFSQFSYPSVAVYEKLQRSLLKEKRDNFIVNYFTKKNIEFSKHENPLEKVKEAFLKFVPKMMFVFLPLFAFILRLVYFRKRKYYYEHLIYSFHTHSAIFLAFIIFGLLGKLSGYLYNISGVLATVGFFYITWYIYRSLRTFYGSGSWVTIFKFLFLLFCYSILLTLGIIVIAGITVVTG